MTGGSEGVSPGIRVLGCTVEMALGIVFLGSVSFKLRDVRGFLKGVADYQVVPQKYAALSGILVILA